MFFCLLLTKILVNYIIMTKILVIKEEDLLLKNKLAEFRKEKNINQTDLGKRIGVSRQTISLIERGDYNPSVMVALSLAKVFSVNVEDIFSLEDDYEKAL